jgi:hypothetical protein
VKQHDPRLCVYRYVHWRGAAGMGLCAVERAMMADQAHPQTIYLQMSDCGQHIRKWSREPFDGCCDYVLQRDRRCWEYPIRGSITASCGCNLGPNEMGELISYWGWDDGMMREFSGSYCIWCALRIKVSGLHIETWVLTQ